jgi:hypothetical protein
MYWEKDGSSSSFFLAALDDGIAQSQTYPGWSTTISALQDRAVSKLLHMAS